MTPIRFKQISKRTYEVYLTENDRLIGIVQRAGGPGSLWSAWPDGLLGDPLPSTQRRSEAADLLADENHRREALR
jgi:hypothetical protein